MEKKTDESFLAELKNAPLFKKLSSQEFSRLYAHLEIKNYNEKDILYKKTEKADTLYVVIKGRAKLIFDKKKDKDMELGPTVLGIVSIFGGRHPCDVVISEKATVASIPRDAIFNLIDDNESIKFFLYEEMVNRVFDDNIEVRKKRRAADTSSLGSWKSIVGWLLAILVPVLIFFATSPETYSVAMTTVEEVKSVGGMEVIERVEKEIKLGLDGKKLHLFLVIFSSTIIMWIFKLTVEAIVALFLVLVLLILGIAPSEVILSGFSSGTFFMALSVLCMGTVLVSSGLTYRTVLYLLRFTPGSQLWYSLCMFGTGMFLTPVLPSANGRINLSTPLYMDLQRSLRYKEEGKASTRLAFATLMGVSLFSAVFLSSKAINFVVYGLLPVQVQDQFSWIYWTIAAAASGLVMIILYLLLSSFFFKNDEDKTIPKEKIKDQIIILGSMKYAEWVAFICLILFFIGMTTVSIHKVELPWIGLALVFVYFCMEVLKKKELKTKIDWPFLILLGSLVGLVRTMNYIGFDQWISFHVGWMGEYMKTNIAFFILLLSLSIIVARLAVPGNAVIAIFSSIFIPLAQVNGINPWIVGFIIITMSDTWIFPYQCTYYLSMREANEPKVYDENLLIKANAITIVIRLVSIYLSIPYWKFLGIL